MNREVYLKTVLLFPGQGSHFAGMGQDLLRAENRFFSDLLEVASDHLGNDLRRFICDVPADSFIKSSNLQPLITAVSLTYWKLLVDEGIVFNTVMGHSLGEITALAGAGVLSAENSVEFAAFRGRMMDYSADKCGGGGMAVVLFSDETFVKLAIEQYGLNESLYIANYNAPNQTVISGSTEALSLFESKFPDEFRAKIQRIDVAGPWHTPFISAGREKYLEWAEKKEFKSPRIDFIMNGTADFALSTENFLLRTADQLIKPVYWYQSLQKVAEHSAGALVVEAGPGKILTGLIRANKLQKSFAGVESVNTLESIRSFVQNYQKVIESGGA